MKKFKSKYQPLTKTDAMSDTKFLEEKKKNENEEINETKEETNEINETKEEIETNEEKETPNQMESMEKIDFKPRTSEDESKEVPSLSSSLFSSPVKFHVFSKLIDRFRRNKCTLDKSKFRKIYCNDSKRTQLEFKYCSNYIKTSKYNLLTFLPVNLFQQFKRVANFYFLVVTIIQLIPGITNISPWSSIVPLVFVLTVSAVKEAIEDFYRYREDKKSNNFPCTILKNGKWVTLPRKYIQVGDVVRVSKDQEIHADLVLLNSSLQEGWCYLKTTNLDGETNLKGREAVKQTQHLVTEEDIQVFCGVIECENPNNNLYQFEGRLIITKTEEEDEVIPLTNSQVLLKGCVLKNTDWIIGVAIFAGHDTKILHNSKESPFKRSSLERKVNSGLIVVFSLLGFLILFSALANILMTNEQEWYLFYNSPNLSLRFFMGLGSFLVLFSVLIPISLYVSIELVRLGQIYFFQNDVDLYDPSTDSRMECRTSNLNEELGQIEYIFSDKTGTLTCNKMELLFISINGTAYRITEETSITSQKRVNIKTPEELNKSPKERNKKEEDGEEIGKSPKEQEEGVQSSQKEEIIEPQEEEEENYQMPLTNEHISEIHVCSRNELLQSLEQENIFVTEAIQLLSVCHTVIPEPAPDSETEILYQAASPDEHAIVTKLYELNIKFKKRTKEFIFINHEKYEILSLLEFSSNRKRMSIICRCPDGKIKLYCKGADSVIMNLCNDERGENRKLKKLTDRHLHFFAEKGLRTLCLGYKELSENEFRKWFSRFSKAQSELANRESLIEEIEEEIEQDLILLGATGVEDKLQEGVPQCIESLRKAGIKVWVLTGDKPETVINIGYSCNLLNDVHLIVLLSNEKVEQDLNSYFKLIKNHQKKEKLSKKYSAPETSEQFNYGMVIEGKVLKTVLETHRLKKKFLVLALQSKAVLCCRVTPAQKKEVVALVKSNVSAITLAIGDGANDVNMIQEAHVGVAIQGVEGRQAVMASDYSISQFRFLEKLLLVHGRWSYVRLAYLLKYFFYKNAAFALIQFWYSFFTQFSGQNLFHSWIMVNFNTLFTGVPIIVYAIFDQDVPAPYLLNYPQLYERGRRNRELHIVVFLIFLFYGVFQSLILYFGGAFIYGTGTVLSNGRIQGLWEMGIAIFGALIITVNLKLARDTGSWTILHFISITGSILIYFPYIMILSILPNIFPELYEISFQVFNSVTFWFTLILLPTMCSFLDFAFNYYWETYHPADWIVIREKMVLNQGGPLIEREIQKLVKRIPFLKETLGIDVGFALPEPNQLKGLRISLERQNYLESPA